MPTAASIASATLCIVFVQSTTHSAPAASSPRASAARRAPAAAQSPDACIASTSAKSTDAITQPGRVEATEPVPDALVDEPVVERRALPAHPAEQSDATHDCH